MTDKISDLRDRWDALRREHEDLEADDSTEGLLHDDPRVLAKEAEVAAFDAHREALADAAWALPARDLADLLLLAEIAYDLHWDVRVFPEVLPEIEATDDRQAIAVAYLCRGIADVAQGEAVPLPPARRAPPETLVAEIARMVGSVAEDEAAIGVLSTGEAIAVALVLNRADLLPHGGYTWLEAVDRLGPEWLAAAHAVQRQRDT